MKNRGERREQSKRKWISRARKVYKSLNNIFIPAKGIKNYSCRFMFKDMRVCESITDFLDNDKYAKILKKCTVPRRTKMEQIENKAKNRKDRKQAKLNAKLEAESYREPIEYTCHSCIHFQLNDGICNKNHKELKGGDCVDFWD